MQKHTIAGNCKGSALVGAVVFSIILAITGVTTLKIISSGSSIHSRELETIRSFWANEGAMRIAYRYLSIETTPDVSVSADCPRQINGYTPSISIQAPGNNRYNISATSQIQRSNQNNTTLVSDLVINNLGHWALYETGGTPQGLVWREMTVDGNYYAGGRVKISSQMPAGAKVSGTLTTADTYTDNSYAMPWNRGLKVQQDGGTVDPGDWNTPGHEVWFMNRLPRYVNVSEPIDYMDVQPDNFSGFEYDYPNNTDWAEVTLNGSDIRIRSTTNNGGSFTTDYNGPISHFSPNGNTIIFDTEVRVQGTLDGQLSLVTTGNQKDIVITGDIMYSNTQIDPNQSGMSNDALALVSNANIEMRWNNGAGEQDYTVYAGLYAPNGTYQVTHIQNFSTRYDFHLYGNLLQSRPGGTWSSGWRPRGILEHYHQDSRFASNDVIPPGIPYPTLGDTEHQQGWRWSISEGQWSNTISKRSS